jgi:hypothetical protein
VVVDRESVVVGGGSVVMDDGSVVMDGGSVVVVESLCRLVLPAVAVGRTSCLRTSVIEPLAEDAFAQKVHTLRARWDQRNP